MTSPAHQSDGREFTKIDLAVAFLMLLVYIIDANLRKAKDTPAGAIVMTSEQQKSNLRVLRQLSLVGFFVFVFLLDFSLAFSVSDLPVESSFWTESDTPLPRSIQSAAERTGNIAAMHDGAGSGVQLQMRGGRSSPTHARRLQTTEPYSDSSKLQESVPICLDCINSANQALFLIRIYLRNCLPSRAGPAIA